VTSWIELEDLALSEISQAQKDKYCMISLLKLKSFKSLKKLLKIHVSKWYN
jgi:hypothetical protein